MTFELTCKGRYLKHESRGKKKEPKARGDKTKDYIQQRQKGGDRLLKMWDKKKYQKVQTI